VAALAAALEAHARHLATPGAADRRAARRRFEVLVRAERRLRRAAGELLGAAGGLGADDASADPEAEASALLRRAAERGGW
jgi:hypothetical protein